MNRDRAMYIDDPDHHEVARMLAERAAQTDAVILDVRGKPPEQPEPAELQGARMTALGAKVLAMQAENAKRIETSDDFGFPSNSWEDDEITLDGNPTIVSSADVAAEEDALVQPPEQQTVTVFNVGKRYTVAPKGAKVRKVSNKFARRILRKRGNEGRVARAVRESGAQYNDARRITGSANEARALVDAQREYVKNGGRE